MSQASETSRRVPQKIETKIWANVADEKGHKTTLCHGYDFYNDILGRYSVSDIFFLLLKGELPDPKESSVMNILMTSIINPGPKDWSTLTAMTAAVSHTTVGNSLIAGISALQSRYNGGLCVEKSMEMFIDAAKYTEKKTKTPDLFQILKPQYPDLPGYGLDRHERDRKVLRLIELIKEENPEGAYLNLAIELENEISKIKKIWLTMPGVIAAILLDLGFKPLDGHGIFIVSSLPGVLSHILAQMKKGGWNTFPFYDTPEYNPENINELTENQKVYGEEIDG
ncbi:MAG: hypothetical protein KJ737_23370 [Proteobacteria bacterium]|nr:hypothetical protein [Pseudomonadota bacterium]